MHALPGRRRRTPRRRPAAALLIALLVPLAGFAAGAAPASAATAATAASPSSAEPLQVVLSSLSPSVVPRSGPLVVRGTVRNVSTEKWRTVNMSALSSTSPMTTAQELARAARTPADMFVGNRLSSPHSFVAVGDLEPGDSVGFALRIPRAELPIPDQAGVYWFGVHALATNDDGREVAGRVRTFLPVVSSPASSASVSLVLPFRQEVHRNLDLTVADEGAWSTLLSGRGRLGRLLSFSQSSGMSPLTLLLDPAVLAVAQSLGAGNPKRTTTDASAAASESASADPTPTPEDAASRNARAWLAAVEAQASRNRVLGLEYADPDTAALATHAPDLLTDAASQAKATFGRLGIDALPAAAPADGVLPLSAVDSLDPETVVLLSDAARSSSSASSSEARLRTPAGQTVVLADSGSASGGPAPEPRTSALAVRQRIVAEAALRAQAGVTAPLVVSLPANWDPGSGWRAADFFGGLDRPWLNLMPLDASSGGRRINNLSYPASATRAQLGSDQLAAIRSLAKASDVYADVLRRPGDVVEQLQRLILINASYHLRGDPGAPARTRELSNGLDEQLRGVQVVGNDFVTLSGGSGSIVVTLVNDLDRSARVGLSVRTAPDLRITTPGPITLRPGERRTVPLPANPKSNGVRAVEVTPVTPQGDAFGTPLRFSVRTSQVSLLVWVVMAAAGALLVVMIVRRAVRRGLRREPARP